MNKNLCPVIGSILLLICLLLPSLVYATDTVKIGAILAKTGRAVNVSAGIRLEFLAVRMAVKELNARGGLLVCFIDDFQGEVMASFAVMELRAKTAVVLTNASEKYSIGLSNFFIAKFKELGGTILWESPYLGDAVDFEKQVLQLKELQPDVTFIPGNNPDVGFIIKQARAIGVKSIFLSGDGPGNGLYRYAQDAAVGLYKSDHWHVEDLTPKSREFVEAFTEQYNQPVISAAAALSYDAVMLLADTGI